SRCSKPDWSTGQERRPQWTSAWRRRRRGGAAGRPGARAEEQGQGGRIRRDPARGDDAPGWEVDAGDRLDPECAEDSDGAGRAVGLAAGDAAHEASRGCEPDQRPSLGPLTLKPGPSYWPMRLQRYDGARRG